MDSELGSHVVSRLGVFRTWDSTTWALVRETRIRERLRWRGPAATVNYWSALSSETAPQIKNPATIQMYERLRFSRGNLKSYTVFLHGEATHLFEDNFKKNNLSWDPGGWLTLRQTGRLTVGRNILMTVTLTLVSWWVSYRVVEQLELSYHLLLWEAEVGNSSEIHSRSIVGSR
jgi:hypothetical protein